MQIILADPSSNVQDYKITLFLARYLEERNIFQIIKFGSLLKISILGQKVKFLLIAFSNELDTSLVKELESVIGVKLKL